MYDNEKTMAIKREIRALGCKAMGVEYNEKMIYQCLVDMGRGKVLAMYIQSCSNGGSYNNNPEIPKANVRQAVEILVTEKLRKSAPQLSEDEVQGIVNAYNDLVENSYWTGTAFETRYGTGRAFVVDLSLRSLLRAKPSHA